MKIMVRRFDEVLSEKASKMALIESEHRIEKHFIKIKHWDRMQDDLQATLMQQKQELLRIERSVQVFETNMSESISRIVTDTLGKTMSRYEKVLSQFSKFFDQEELNSVLERKADVDYV